MVVSKIIRTFAPRNPKQVQGYINKQLKSIIMKPIFVKRAEDTMRGVKVGNVIIDLYPSINIGFNYGTMFNPETFEFPYDGVNAICLNDLAKQGKCEEVQCYRMYDIDFPCKFKKLTPKVMKDIIEKFKAHGFNVTKKAVQWQYDNWSSDLKSGYRDEENGYHLFSPCGCNPFSLRATTLHPLCADWQTTYWC